MIHSMTGFATRSFSFQGETYKIELKSLNHRFLDLKIRMPKTFGVFEPSLKALVESKLKRGSVDIWIERTSTGDADSQIKINEKNAHAAFKVLSELRHQFQIEEAITIRDLVSFPDVVEKNAGVILTKDEEASLSHELKHHLSHALDDLIKMRSQEGEKLRTALLSVIAQFKKAHGEFIQMRDQIQERAKTKIKKRVDQCFEAYGTIDERLRALMESRIAQEISYTLEKLDIEEELTRYKGHVDQIEELLKLGGQVGKKLDFMFQELNREINTLGNKAQDLGVSQEVISLKMWIEQMREQSLNLE